MSGPAPKNPALRQRRNKSSTRATLTAQQIGRKRAPLLPKRTTGEEWHPLTRAFWRDVWHSPMSAEYLSSDVHGLYRVAMLVDRFWKAPTVYLEAQINRSGAEYGLSPISRRRLEWIVEKAEEGKKRQRPASAFKPADDPRRALFQVVS